MQVGDEVETLRPIYTFERDCTFPAGTVGVVDRFVSVRAAEEGAPVTYEDADAVCVRLPECHGVILLYPGEIRLKSKGG